MGHTFKIISEEVCSTYNTLKRNTKKNLYDYRYLYIRLRPTKLMTLKGQSFPWA